ncbi:lysine/arginine/ornithine ABC transporter substrate-binding protein [Microvirga sp. M2]|uniref:lysine/arginine/ornithine ABC transporter substrate-binding protein n=1 Tax=Microvirga sp. M2 TaxID=3073270 RepID=UPI0039C4888D
MKTLGRLALAAIGIAMAPALAHAQSGKITSLKIATEGAFAPWNFTGAGGKLEGFEIDLANDLCKRMNVTCEIVAQDWDGIIPALNAKKYDAIVAGMSITDKRLEVIDFSRPYAQVSNGIVVAKNSPESKALGPVARFNLTSQPAESEAAVAKVREALKGKTLGVQTSSSHSSFTEKYLAGAVEIREYKTTEQYDLDLAAGRIDAVIGDTTALRGTLDKPEFKDFAVAGPGFSGGVLGRGVAVGLRKDSQELKGMFDPAIAAAIADGTVKQLSEKWFKVDMTPQG